jgi:hypothetical protein
VTQALIFVALVALAATVALVLQRRARPAPRPQPRYSVPADLDRDDFVRPDAPWLVAVFTSTTCHSCADTWDKARLLESDAVAVARLEVQADAEVHRRYGIDAVPLVLVADVEGAVRASFLGPPTATDLWATLAELRDPGSTPPTCDHHGSAPGG